MLSVFLVDDEPIVKVAFRRLIDWEALEFQIAGTASNGLEALRLLKQRPADIVITDLKMPQMDGIELIHALKRDGFEGIILVLSNYADFTPVREALTAGAMDYMLKVNINKESLTQQLLRAKEALAAQRKSHRREQLVAEHGAVLRAHTLRAYLTAERQAEPPQVLLDAYERGSFGVMHLSFFAPGTENSAHMPAPSHAEAVLRAVFEDVQDTDIVLLNERDLLCVYPAQALRAKGIAQQSKAEQIARHMQIYLGASALILMCADAACLDDILAQQRLLADAAALSFYALPTAILSPLVVQFGPLPEGHDPQAAAQRLAKLHFEAGSPSVHAYLADFLGDCRKAWTHPRDVARFLQMTAEHLLTFAPQRAADGRIAEDMSGFTGLRHERELLTRAHTLFEGILEQIVPPAYAHCKEEVRKALLYVHTHYRMRISLDDVARASNLDRSYLCRLFKRETGVNLFAYLNRLRMDAAALLIAGGNGYIRGVAAQVGIDDPFYFTRVFKKHFGVAPSDYHGADAQ